MRTLLLASLWPSLLMAAPDPVGVIPDVEGPSEAPGDPQRDLPGDVAVGPEADRPLETTDALAWTLVLTGVTAIATGAVVFAFGVDDEQAVKTASGDGRGQLSELSRSRALDLYDRGQDRQALGGAALGVGSALVAAGMVLWYVEYGNSGRVGLVVTRAGWLGARGEF